MNIEPTFLHISLLLLRGTQATRAGHQRVSSVGADRALPADRVFPEPYVWFQDWPGRNDWLYPNWRVPSSFGLLSHQRLTQPNEQRSCVGYVCDHIDDTIYPSRLCRVMSEVIRARIGIADRGGDETCAIARHSF